MNITWKDVDEFNEYFDKFIDRKKLKDYRVKYWDISMWKRKSLKVYYKSIYWNNYVSIEKYIKSKPNKTSKTKLKKKNRRKINKENNIKKYRDYINSKERKEKRIKFFRKFRNKCQCCKQEFLDKNLNLHHHTYDRLWKELDSDLVVVCIQCHHDIHFENSKKVRLQEKILRNRFNDNNILPII